MEAKEYDSGTLKCALKPLSGSAAILSLAGEIDLATADTVGHCFRLLADEELAGVLIDATEVTFIDSSGLHALVEGKRLMHDLGCRIVLVPSRRVRKLLEIVFPEPMFAARVDSIEEGLAVLNSDNS
ncbi:MAG TPA: STAS domain-containing protein [Acidimicrobiia bacterium]|nr:STAS domain-containing protein [Acidimicrobiia bacterium]